MLGREVHAHPSRFSRVMPLELRRAPLLYVAAVFAMGIAASQWWRPGALLVSGTAICLLIAGVALWKAPRLAIISALSAWFMLGWSLGVLHPRSSTDRALLPYTDGLRREVVATVVSVQPLPTRSDEQDADPLHFGEQAADQEAGATEQIRYTADLQLRQIERLDPDVVTMPDAAGTARVVLAGLDGAALQCGSNVRAVLRLYRPREFRDPGVWRYGDWLAEQQVSATGTAVPSHVWVTQNAQSAPLSCRFQQVRTWADGRLHNFAAWQRSKAWLPAVLRWNASDVAAWTAMLFGERGALTHRLRADFERTGTFHLFVVSGMHIGLVAAAVFWLADRMRCGRLLTTLLTALATSGYALLTGFGQPVQRALFMTLVFLLAQASGRERNALNAVGAAVLAMLLVRPQSLRDSGLQMTVLIALTIAGIAVPLLERTVAPYARACRNLPLLRLDRRLPPHVAQFRVRLRWLATELELSCGRWASLALLAFVRAAFALLVATLVAFITELTMALPMTFYFHRFTAFALPANLLVIPLLVPLMICGILSFLLSLVSYPLAMVAAAPAALLLHGAAWLVRALASLHGANLRTPGPTLAATVALAASVGLCVVLLRLRRPAFAWAAVALACGVSVGTIVFARHMRPPLAFRVTAIDVGQGDSVLLTAPNGQALLIDAGGIVGPERNLRQNNAGDAFDTGEEVVSPYLWHLGISRLDVLALSHAHMDHLGGMSAVLRNFRPRELWLSVDVPSERLHTLLAEARAQGTAIRFLRAGSHVEWQQVHLDVLGPQPAYAPGLVPTNDDSLVLRAAYGRSSALLAGDAELPSEEAMMAAHLLSPVTLLKVGHHGSMTSSSAPFLDALEPKVAVISCGRGNHFGHPRMPVLERLGQHHALTARTDTMGAVQYTLHSDGSVTTLIPADDK
ncbi:ComEC/Rec2 family competence protein [Terriglobus sp.]|uniref:ComEC/Rec2 family competence protein n=1 Tax=Terriglobus sp. TaxID=1889013 RepID=UPI003AFFCC8B